MSLYAWKDARTGEVYQWSAGSPEELAEECPFGDRHPHLRPSPGQIVAVEVIEDEDSGRLVEYVPPFPRLASY